MSDTYRHDIGRAGLGCGPSTLEAWKARSPLAAAVAPAMVDGQIDVDKVLDQAARLGRQLNARMVEVSGQEEGFHRPFADTAKVATLRAGMMVADATNQYRDAGILRLNALEASSGPLADPVFFMSVAAWDAMLPLASSRSSSCLQAAWEKASQQMAWTVRGHRQGMA